MKKILLSLMAACVCLSSAAADLTQLWNKSTENAFKAENKQWNAPIAVDAVGNVIATGAFTEDFTLAGTSLEALGTSAYIVKYDKTGTAAWAIALTGAASISAIDTDADGNIYVAGTFADEVSFGTTSGDAIVKNGLTIDGEPTTMQNASFVAKYDANGKLAAVESFLPEPFADLAATGAYFPSQEDIYFRINHLKVNGNNVYLSAVFTNDFNKGTVKLSASYNDPWGIGFYTQLSAVCVLSLDKSLENCTSIVSCFVPEHLYLSEEEYKAQSINFDANNESVFATITGSGALKIETAKDSNTLTANFDQYNYIFAEIKDGAIAQFVTNRCPEAGAYATYTPSFVKINDDKLIVAGDEAFAENYGEDNERVGNEIFVFTASANDLAGIQKKVYEPIDGAITYYDMASASILSNGELYINTFGYYNTTKEGEYRKGDFANVAKSFIFDNDQFTAATIVTDAVGIATADSYVAFSQIGETGATFSLYTNDTAGIEDIVADENAPVEYYNLQGVRVDNPAAGSVVIRRQGANATKVLVK